MDRNTANFVDGGAFKLKPHAIQAQSSEKIENNRFCRTSVGAKALKQIVMCAYIVYTEYTDYVYAILRGACAGAVPSCQFSFRCFGKSSILLSIYTLSRRVFERLSS